MLDSARLRAPSAQPDPALTAELDLLLAELTWAFGYWNVAALVGGTLAASTHLTKASTRAVANTSPEPFSNWFLSFIEDAFVIGLGALALKYPAIAAIVVIVCVVMIVAFASWIIRAIRRRLLPRPAES